MGNCNKSSSESSALISTDERKQPEPTYVGEQSGGNCVLYDTAAESGETMEQLEGIQRDLKADDHPSNVLSQFAKVVLLDGSDKMSNFPQMVDAMGKQWTGILEQEDMIVQHLSDGKEGFNKLKGLRTDYFFLLLDTKKVIAGLVKQSSLKKEDIEMILEAVESTRNQKAHKLSDSDQLLFTESMSSLLKWIDEGELITLTKKWEAMIKRLEAEKNKFDEIMEKFKKKAGWSALKLWKRTILGFTALALLGAGIGLIVASVITCGATAAVAGIVMVGALGVLSLNAHDVYSCLTVKPKNPKEYAKIKEITEMLQSYIAAGSKLREQVNNMAVAGKETKIEVHSRREMGNTHIRRIEKAAKNLDAHLSKYMEQGTKAICVIDEACAEFIKQ